LFSSEKKAPKAPRPQSFNYAPQVVEKKKPSYAPSPAPVQYYDYEEEIPTTQRPVQIARPKYNVPQQQFASAPQRPQQFGSGGIVYAPEARAPAPQFQQFENRQPLQFPSENASPAPQSNNRPEEFSLFKPASERSDTFQSKVSPKSSERTFKLLNRKLKKWKVFKRKLKHMKGKILRRLKRNKKIYYIVKKKRSYFD
jgi:hypothetical protein